MTITIPEFWLGYVCGTICTVLLLLAAGAWLSGRSKPSGSNEQS